MMKLNMEYCTDVKTIVFTVMTAHSSHSIHLLNGNIIIIIININFSSVNTLI